MLQIYWSAGPVQSVNYTLPRTRMVRKIVPYAYGTVCTIRVRYKIRIWYIEHIYLLLNGS